MLVLLKVDLELIEVIYAYKFEYNSHYCSVFNNTILQTCLIIFVPQITTVACNRIDKSLLETDPRIIFKHTRERWSW